MSYLILSTGRRRSQSGAFTFSLFIQIRERGDAVKCQLSSLFCFFLLFFYRERKKNRQTSGFGLLFLSPQLTAPKSQVWLQLDSSLYQVTQHPTSLHPSTQHDVAHTPSPSLHFSQETPSCRLFLFHNCLLPASSVLALS